MKKVLTFIIVGIFILAIFVLSRQPAGYRRLLEEKDRIYGNQIDSIRGVVRVLAERDSSARRKLDSLSNALKQAQKQATDLKTRYDRQKTRFKPLSDPAIDSLINSYR